MDENRIATAALQYSKWMSKFICWVWALYRVFTLVAAATVPEAADALVSAIAGLDTIMIINEGTYLINSLGEKIIYSDRFVISWLEKGGFNSLVRKTVKIASKISKDKDEVEDELEVEEEEEQEEGDNDGYQNG